MMKAIRPLRPRIAGANISFTAGIRPARPPLAVIGSGCRPARTLLALISLVLLLTACSRRTNYNILEQKELARGVRYDSLFLGLRFGMTQKEFFDHCQELHQRGFLVQGGLRSGRIAARYRLQDGLPSTALLNFYPDFYKDRIYRMEADFNYEAWSPWNKRLFADSLKKDLARLFEEWYGKGFIELADSGRGDVWLKIDGNRRIVITGNNDNNEMYVTAIFTDLTVAKNL